jgi:hypothetical protein
VRRVIPFNVNALDVSKQTVTKLTTLPFHPS